MTLPNKEEGITPGMPFLVTYPAGTTYDLLDPQEFGGLTERLQWRNYENVLEYAKSHVQQLPSWNKATADVWGDILRRGTPGNPVSLQLALVEAIARRFLPIDLTEQFDTLEDALAAFEQTGVALWELLADLNPLDPDYNPVTALTTFANKLLTTGLFGAGGEIVGGFFQQGVMSIAALANFVTNWLENPTFESADPFTDMVNWAYDAAVSHSATGGSATALGDGTLKELISDPAVRVVEGLPLDISEWVRWSGVTAVGDAFRLVAMGYDNVDGLGTPVVSQIIDAISNPPAASSNPAEDDFEQLVGSWTIPAGVMSVRHKLVQTENVTAGQSWWDDGVLAPNRILDPEWVEGLPDNLADLATLIQNLFGGTIGSQILEAAVPTLAQSKIFGLTTDLANRVLTTTHQALLDGLHDLATLTSGSSGISLSDVIEALQSYPGAYITGWGGPGTAVETWQATWDQIVAAGTGVLGATGASLADVFNVFYQNASDAAQGPMAFNLFGGLNNTRAMWRGRLPSSDTTLPISQIMFAKNTSGVPTVPTFAITQAGGAHTTWEILQQDVEKNVVQWRGHYSGSITDFRARILKMDPANGTVTPQQVSGNLIGQLSTTPGSYMTWTLDTPFEGTAGDIIGIELQPIGSGTFNAVGDQTWDTVDHPTIYPRRLASIRSGSGTTTTLGSAYNHLTGFAYTDKLAAIEFAISTGNPPAPHAPVSLSTTGVGAGTYPVPDWCNTVQLIVFPAGGKGANNPTTTMGWYGNGGNAGTPGSLILTRGTHFGVGAIIDFNAGAGSTGSDGGASSAGITTGAIGGPHTISRAGGTDGSGTGLGISRCYGDSPGNITVDGIPYNGGAQQTDPGSAGNVPGGAGAGGGYFSNGGNGARGVVYIRLKQ